MDVATAKTLVSLTLIVAIAMFSFVSIEMFVRQMVKDLRVSSAERAAAEHHE